MYAKYETGVCQYEQALIFPHVGVLHQKRIPDDLFLYAIVHVHKTVTMYITLHQLIYRTYNQVSQ